MAAVPLSRWYSDPRGSRSGWEQRDIQNKKQKINKKINNDKIKISGGHSTLKFWRRNTGEKNQEKERKIKKRT